ncbi:MAG: glycosyltransferase family 2 protein [Gammaproteobacteria bacterium]|nr:glycosyltransferase family 2 protein [Gammaproteobacteria bacterium]
MTEVAAMSPEQPLVSVCIPAYKERDLKTAIGSALAQTYRNIEVIVSDDAPTDAIRNVCAEFGTAVQYVCNEDRVGRGRGNYRNLIRLARGKYLKFLLDDDFLHPFCVSELVRLAEHPSGPRLVASLRQEVNEAGEPVKIINPFQLETTLMRDGRELIRIMALYLSNPIGEFSTVLIRREDMLEPSGEPWGFDLEGELWRGLDDVATWIRLGLRGPVAIHATPLSYFRRHLNANSNPAYNPEFIYAVTDWAMLLKYAVKHNFISGEEIERSLARLREIYDMCAHLYPELSGHYAQTVAELKGG